MGLSGIQDAVEPFLPPFLTIVSRIVCVSMMFCQPAHAAITPHCAPAQLFQAGPGR
jgi:hypothetical protein